MLSPQLTKDARGRIVSITIPRPSDLHCHFRWEGMIDDVAPPTMRHNKHVLAMPNNGPGEGGIVRTLDDAHRVHQRLTTIRERHGITTLSRILMTLYHTADTTPAVAERIATSPIVRAIKDYPGHGGTTNSGHGVPFDQHDDLARACVEFEVARLFHAEDLVGVDGRPLPHAEREAHCVEHRLWKFRDKYPGPMCLEHASTREAIEFVKADRSGNTVMTVTPQHLLFTADDFPRYSWRNHLRCMPYVKTEDDRQALLDFVTSGDSRCIAGTDTAPHPSAKKHVAFEDAVCGCWLPHSIALYALAFMQRDALDDRFVRFMSRNGPAWWNLELPREDDTVTIVADTERDIPDPTPLQSLNDVVIPLGWSEDLDRLKVGYAMAMGAPYQC